MSRVNLFSQKKRKDNLEGTVDRVLFAAELVSPKILVPRLPQHTSDANIQCAGNCIIYIWPASWSPNTC